MLADVTSCLHGFNEDTESRNMVRGLFGLVGFTLCVASACGNDAVVEARTPRQVEAPHEAVAAVTPPPPPAEDLPGLDPDVVVAVVNDHQGAVTGCHVIEQSNATLDGPGSVTLTWSIAPSGQVKNVEIADSTFSNASFHDCIIGVIAGLEFPAAAGTTEVGGWRFRFRSREN